MFIRTCLFYLVEDGGQVDEESAGTIFENRKDTFQKLDRKGIENGKDIRGIDF